MAEDAGVIKLFAYCASKPLLRPIANFMRFLQPMVIANERVSALKDKIIQDPGLPCPNPTTSYWQVPPHPSLSDRQSKQLKDRVDVVIIGSGITSASIAHQLLTSDPNITVTILEARTLTSGATGRNGGHILEIPYEEYDLEVSLLGREQAKELVAFRLSHLDELVRFSKKFLPRATQDDSEIRVVEAVDAVFDEKTWVATKLVFNEFITDFPDQKGKWRLWEKKEARENFGMPDVCGCVTGPAGAIWPYRFVTGVFETLLSQYPDRINIETNTPVQDVKTSDDLNGFPYLCLTPRGQVRSRHVVHATNGHVGRLLPRMRGRIAPLRGQMTVQQHSNTDLPNLGGSRSWLLRYAKGYDYMTQNAKTGLYFLGGGLFQGDGNGVSDAGNASDAEQNFLSRCHLTGVLPRLFGQSTDSDATNASHTMLKSSWTGVMGFSCDGRPWVGRLPASVTQRQPKSQGTVTTGEWIAAGFCGAGMVFCWRSGQAVGDMILGKEAKYLPACLLSTEKRFKSGSPSDLAGFFFAITA